MMLHIKGPNNKSSLTNVQPGDVQPNAVDLRIDKIFSISNDVFSISEDGKKHRGTKELTPDSDGNFYLIPGTYEVVMENIITIGEGEAGWVITRSTLNRNGVFITSGLYDSGYNGVMAGAMHVKCGPAIIKRGTRVGQFLLFKSETLKMYDGDYGLNKEHDKKYGV
jgi:deoxycytidine triphosphate deaminase